MSQSGELVVGINFSVRRISDSIRDIIATTNERYAASHGKDLFKATNKSTKAINAIGKPITYLDSYKNFISNLFFVFRESIGQRLVDQLPPSFAEVTDLRTMMQHDVDHGKAGKAASKRKKLARVFSKYSGVSSPDAVDPAQFPLVQANILGALETDLHALAKSFAQGT